MKVPEFPTYEAYKDSGVEWLGRIPAHWEVRRNLGVFDERNVRGRPDDELLSVTIEHGVIPQSEIMTKKDSSNEDKSKYKVVREGDLAYNKMRAWQGALGISPYNGIVSPAYIILRPKNPKLSKYFHYLFRTSEFITEANRLSYGLCEDMNSLRYEPFKGSYSPIPPDDEVDQIVAFLDEKTAMIDELIAKKKRQIELLEEQKAILINRAVTRGLNPDVKLKPSGIDWIGEIPHHWVVRKARYLFTEENQRSEDGSETHLSMSQRFGLVPADSLSEKSLQSESYEGAKLCFTGDLVLNRLKAHLGVFSVAKQDRVISPDYSVFRLLSSENEPLFFEYLFKTPGYIGQFNKVVRGIVVGFYRLYTGDLFDIPCAVPPPSEQKEILEGIKEVSTRITKLKSTTLEHIDSLKTLRSTLIAHAVTGRIKV